jgi:hypothetical protein
MSVMTILRSSWCSPSDVGASGALNVITPAKRQLRDLVACKANVYWLTPQRPKCHAIRSHSCNSSFCHLRHLALEVATQLKISANVHTNVCAA